MTKRDGNPPDFVLNTMTPSDAVEATAEVDLWNLAIQQATGGGSIKTSPPKVAPEVTELIVRDMQERGEAPPEDGAARRRDVAQFALAAARRREETAPRLPPPGTPEALAVAKAFGLKPWAVGHHAANVTYEPPVLSAPEVRFVRLAGGAEAPSRAHPDDAGYDLVVSRDVRIAANSFEDVHSDIAVELPAGYWARVTGRSSSLRVHGLLVSEGVIDGGYRGELFVGVWNLRGVPVTVKAGWRIAQIIIVPLVVLPWTEVSELGESGRGRNGFGSTGV